VDEKSVNKKVQREILFLMGLVFIVVIILALIIAYWELTYGRNPQVYFLIIFPPVFLLAIFSAFYLWKKGLMNPNSQAKKGFDILFDRKRYF
jgi:hypothetical protein